MNIALFDTGIPQELQLYSCIEKIVAERSLSVQLHLCESAIQFLAGFYPGRYDIVFLDMDIRDVDAVKTAVSIREIDARCKLVFVSGRESFVVASYEVMASYYLLKPAGYADVERALERCLQDDLKKSSYIEIISNRRRKKILMGDIVYAHTYRNSVLIHTTSGVERVYMFMTQFLPKVIHDDRFLQCSQGKVVNMDYITGAAESAFVLTTGETVSMRKRNAGAIKSIYERYRDKQAAEAASAVASQQREKACI